MSTNQKVWFTLFMTGTLLCVGIILVTQPSHAAVNDVSQVADYYEFQTIPTDGLVAYYPFNGNANDESGNGNDGTVFGATLAADRFGIPNHAYSFDGMNNFIDLGNQNIIDDNAAFSVSLWANISGGSDGGPTMIRLKGYTSEFQFTFRYNMPLGTALYFGFRQFAGITCNESQYILDNLRDEWHHYVIVYNGGDKNSIGSYEVYIDGVSISLELFNIVGGWENVNELGRDWMNLDHLAGVLDDIRIYNRVLTEAEILALYNEAVTDPVVIGIDPNIAIANTGDLPVTISGLYFSTPITAQLDGVSLVDLTLVSSTTLNAVVPVNDLEVGVYDLVITSDGVTATLHDAFTVGAEGPWYVTPNGDDGNDCLSPATPCATINGALNKPGFLADSTILVAEGTYAGTGDEVVLLNKSVTLSGGWDAAFTVQDDTSTIDGEDARRGIFVNDDVTANVDHFTIQHGYTGEGNGGGIYNSGTLILTHSDISDNFAEFDGYFGHGGGGIYNIGSLTLINSSVSHNTARDGGGGIYATNGSSTAIMDSQIYANTSMNWEGGGIQVHLDSDLTMSRSWVVGNAALGNDAGGIGSNDAESIYIENSIIAGNTAGGTGGGLWGGRLYRIRNSHIVGNQANGDGAAIAGYYAQIDTINTLVIGNTGYTGISSQWGSDAVILLSYCDTYGNSPDGAYGATIIRTNCLGALPEDGLDPQMAGGALPSGVGPDYADQWLSYDYRLLPGSPAIDAGTPAGAPTTDIEGNPRDVTPDMGAYEAEPVIPLNIDIKPGSDPNAINCHAENSIIPVAILSTEEFDATSVDHTTVTFEGASEIHFNRKSGEILRHEEDVDADGDIDLVFHFRFGETDLTCESTTGTLTGLTFDGIAVRGTDTIQTVPPNRYSAQLSAPGTVKTVSTFGLLGAGLVLGLALVIGLPARTRKGSW